MRSLDKSLFAVGLVLTLLFMFVGINIRINDTVPIYLTPPILSLVFSWVVLRLHGRLEALKGASAESDGVHP